MSGGEWLTNGPIVLWNFSFWVLLVKENFLHKADVFFTFPAGGGGGPDNVRERDRFATSSRHKPKDNPELKHTFSGYPSCVRALPGRARKFQDGTYRANTRNTGMVTGRGYFRLRVLTRPVPVVFPASGEVLIVDDEYRFAGNASSYGHCYPYESTSCRNRKLFRVCERYKIVSLHPGSRA